MRNLRDAGPLAAAAATAILYRSLYLARLRDLRELLEPVLDGAEHLAWAQGLLAGTWPGPEAFFRAPGYVFLLAAEVAVLGPDPARLAAFQLLLGTVTPVLVAALALRLFGRTAAWIAGVGAGLYSTLAFFDAQLLAPVLAVPLTLGAALATLSAVERGGRGRILLAGLLWSAAGIVRPPLLLASAPLPLFLLRKWGARPAAAALGLVLVFPLLVTARNAAVGDPAFIASQGGLNFYLGNRSGADGMAATFPDAPHALGYSMMDAARAIAERDARRPLGSAEISAHWLRRAVGDVRADPGAWLGLQLRKAALFWVDREIPNNHDPALFAERIPLLRWAPGWGLWAPLGIVGFWLGRRRMGVRILGAILLTVALGCVVFFVNARFRLPAAPLLVVLGGGALAGTWRRFRGSGVRAAATPAAAMILLGTLVHANPYGVSREPWIQSYVLVAEAETRRGEHVRALRWIDRALAIEPTLYPARRAQVDLLRRTGQVAEARRVAERLRELLPADVAVRTELAALLALSGEGEAALREVDSVIAQDPAYDPAYVNRALILAGLGEGARAAADLRAFLAERPASREAPRAVEALRTIESGELDGG